MSNDIEHQVECKQRSDHGVAKWKIKAASGMWWKGRPNAVVEERMGRESKHNLRISAEKMSKQMGQKKKRQENRAKGFSFSFFLNGDVKGIFSCIVSKELMMTEYEELQEQKGMQMKTVGGERLQIGTGMLCCAEGKARCKVQTGVPDGGMISF